jgi:putative glutamine amidotransferase
MPMIGVTPLWDDARDSLWMLPGYHEGILAAGGLPVTLPLTAAPEVIALLVERCHGFLFTGGQDVDPKVYGERNEGLTGEISQARDDQEKALLEAALAAGKPVFGICRGIQIINALLGGSLYQDLPRQLPGVLVHAGDPGGPIATHEVELTGELSDLAGTETAVVNSYHHQGVRQVAPGLSVVARAPDGLVEAVVRDGEPFCWAVQWHPECSLDDPLSQALFRRFVEACAGSAA